MRGEASAEWRANKSGSRKLQVALQWRFPACQQQLLRQPNPERHRVADVWHTKLVDGPLNMLPLTSGAHLGSHPHAGHLLSNQATLPRRSSQAPPATERVQAMSTEVASSSHGQVWMSVYAGAWRKAMDLCSCTQLALKDQQLQPDRLTHRQPAEAADPRRAARHWTQYTDHRWGSSSRRAPRRWHGSVSSSLSRRSGSSRPPSLQACLPELDHTLSSLTILLLSWCHQHRSL